MCRREGWEGVILTFVVEPINPVDTCTFVVSPEDEEVLRVLDLVCEEEADGFERLLAPIDIIAEEEVVCFRRESTVFKES